MRYFAIGILVLLASSAAAQTTFTVNVVDDRSDFNPGDGSCAIEPIIFPPECSLRAALQEANATAGAVVIEFSDNLPTDSFGRSVIEVEFELPMIVNRVTIDGTSRSDYVPGSRQPRIIIRYSGTAITANGLLFAAGSSRSAVRALAIEGFPDSGIVLAEGDRYTVEECNIGLAWHPAAVSTNGNGGNGIGVYDGSSSGGSTLIRDNLIAYNGNSGIRISNGSAAVIMQGNIIGLRPPVQTENRFIPAAAAGNGGHGVEIRANAGPNNFIGLINPNTISNNIAGEILIEADQQSVIGNLIGLPHEFKVAADFTAGDYGRGDIAVDVRGSDNVIGGDIAANANHIGNAVLANLRLRGKLSTGNQIRSNFIGVMPNGTEVSASRGILIDEAENTLIDGVVVAGSEVNIHSAGVGTEIVNSKISNGATGVLFDRPGTLGGESLASANVVGENDIGVLVRNDEIENPFTQGALHKCNSIISEPTPTATILAII